RRLRAFRYVTWAALTVSAVLLFAFLRRLGHGEAASLLGVALFVASPPVRECLDNYFITEPLTLVLALAFLLAVESGSHPAVMALWATLGALSKENALALVPLVYFARRERLGNRAALVESLWVLLPAAAALIILHGWWTPYVRAPIPQIGIGFLAAVNRNFQRTWPLWIEAYLLGGLTILALFGAVRRRARPFLRRYGYLLLATMVLPVFNSAMFPFAARVLGADLLRYFLYALPGILPLCLVALDRIYPHIGAAPAPASSSRASRTLAAVSVLLALSITTLRVDRYRRIDLSGNRDGLLHLTLIGQSLRTARRIERDEIMEWNFDDPWPTRWTSLWAGRVERWFLRDGWELSRGVDHRETVVAKDDAPSLLLPVLEPGSIDITLSLSAREPLPVHVEVNGHTVGAFVVGVEPREQAVRVPARLLFRGDNLVTLRFPDKREPGARLHRYALERERTTRTGTDPWQEGVPAAWRFPRASTRVSPYPKR
ncbi:MAG TPA: hypothetical protein VIE88_07065, partial [Vicinamibacteria bacterium]